MVAPLFCSSFFWHFVLAFFCFCRWKCRPRKGSGDAEPGQLSCGGPSVDEVLLPCGTSLPSWVHVNRHPCSLSPWEIVFGWCANGCFHRFTHGVPVLEMVDRYRFTSRMLKSWCSARDVPAMLPHAIACPTPCVL